MTQGNPDPGFVRTFNQAVHPFHAAGDDLADREAWTDEALMAGIALRDEAAFVVLYERYAALVYSTSLRVLADSQLAEDAAQDIFVRLWRRPEAFQPERGRFLSWLLSVVRNRAVDELRVRGRRRQREVVSIGLTDEDDHRPSGSNRDDPELSAQLAEEQVLVREALLGLPPEQRQALELAYFGGLTQQEIAIGLKQPLGTIKTRMRLGMQKLRRTLERRI
jgi:RNA polymerase sigma-70 factor (ECF subfamily)